MHSLQKDENCPVLFSRSLSLARALSLSLSLSLFLSLTRFSLSLDRLLAHIPPLPL